MIRFFWGLLLAAASFYIASLYESTAIALLGCVQILLMVLSFGYLVYEKKRLRVTLDMPPAMADQRESVYIRFRAKHRYRGCYGKIKVQVAVSKERNGSEKRSRARCKWLQAESSIDGTRGKKGRAREREMSGFLSIAEPGSYEIRLRRVKIYDMTGLFCMSCRRAVKEEKALLGVLPSIYPMGIRLSEAIRNFAGDAEVYDSLRSGMDASETLKLRPFQKGDELRNIHWKLSAKEGELVVRENSMPKGCPVVLLAEASGGIQEAQLQCVASLSFCLMDLECPHYVVWYSNYLQDVVRMRVDDEEGFYEALLYLLREGGTKGSLDIRERYREKYSGEPLLHWIRVGHGPSFRVDDQEPLHLKASMLEKELGELELQL